MWCFASERGFKGVVWIYMSITEEGTIKVIESNHNCCVEVYKKVVNQLDGNKIEGFTKELVGEHKVKLIFDIQ